ncbi:MAG: orotate phosphoribosyltransferase [Alicyclobacillaceae bacterium]|jgi:orotate phosphoribosyltransferase|nr:orotate phosphoribosyltransferase [Alicyclobacillaceae bacterium]
MEQSVWLAGSKEQTERIAQGMLQAGVVELRPNSPFVWSSGWHSPMYCDNRLIMAYPLLWNLVLAEFMEAIRRYFPAVEVLAGTATAGIPHAAALADRLNLPMAYVRSSAKEHGKGKRVEGRTGQSLRTVIVEDTLSTGRSALDAATALEEEHMNVLGVVSIFSYDFDVCRDSLNERKLTAFRAVDYASLIDAAAMLGVVSDSEVRSLQEWRLHPEQYGH